MQAGKAVVPENAGFNIPAVNHPIFKLILNGIN